MAALYDGAALHARALQKCSLHARELRSYGRCAAGRMEPRPACWPWACRGVLAACLRFPASCRSSTRSSTIPARTGVAWAAWKESCCPTSSSPWLRLKAELESGKGFPVVHIASHFVVETGSGDEPFLMMGGEDKGDANGYRVESLRHGALNRRLSRHAAPHPLRMQHGKGLQDPRRHERWTAWA